MYIHTLELVPLLGPDFGGNSTSKNLVALGNDTSYLWKILKILTKIQ